MTGNVVVEVLAAIWLVAGSAVAGGLMMRLGLHPVLALAAALGVALASLSIFVKLDESRCRAEINAEAAIRADPDELDFQRLKRVCELNGLDYDEVANDIEAVKLTARIEYLSDDGKSCVWCHYHVGQAQVSGDEFRNVWSRYPILTINGRRVGADCMAGWLREHKDGRWTKSL